MERISNLTKDLDEYRDNQKSIEINVEERHEQNVAIQAELKDQVAAIRQDLNGWKKLGIGIIIAATFLTGSGTVSLSQIVKLLTGH